MRPWIAKRLGEHVELLLTIAGVLVAVALTVTVATSKLGLALTFLVWFQGFVLWAAHRHARLRREALLERLRIMLQDRVNNQLTVILTMTDIGDRSLSPADREAIERASNAARTVADELANLSVESLQTWEHRYRHMMTGAAAWRSGQS